MKNVIATVHAKCSSFVIRERFANGSEWTSEPIVGDEKRAVREVVAGACGVAADGFRWAETANGTLVVGKRP